MIKILFSIKNLLTGENQTVLMKPLILCKKVFTSVTDQNNRNYNDNDSKGGTYDFLIRRRDRKVFI